ncbi:MAG: hypothetical protein ACNYPH_05915 [Gammaproteobacteria bacterium WSBS_2016_MAG_OTU1]
MPRRFRFRFRLLVKDEYQPLGKISKWLWGLLAFTLTAQLVFHHYQPDALVDQRGFKLWKPPSINILQAASFGDPLLLSRGMMLNLQAFDSQQGESLSFKELDYNVLTEWLDRIVALDEKTQYPHFSAANVYATVSDNERRLIMIEWVRKHFREMPDARWESMARAAHVVQYIIKDEKLGLELAQEIRLYTSAGKVPGWARQMEAFLLENKNQYEAATSLLFNLLQDGEVTDPIEFTFLLDRIEGMVKTMVEEGQVRSVEELREIENKLQSLRQMFVEQFDEEGTEN